MIEIRKLEENDFSLFYSMIRENKDDYITNIFSTLTKGSHHLYGLFYSNKLVVTAGFTIYKDSYAMLGRLRSDKDYRRLGLATTLIKYLMDKTFKMENIIWVGANTEENNFPALKILHRAGLNELTTLYSAKTTELDSMIHRHNSIWKEVMDLSTKRTLLDAQFTQNNAIFPYECYYPLPASKALFTPNEIDSWRFFENEKKTRYFIVKKDVKKYSYLHIVYPWDDLHNALGLWETVYTILKNEAEQFHIWIDLTKDEVERLPQKNPFTIEVPWILHGLTREEYREEQKNEKNN